jgi:hypothetical protein
LGLTQVHATSLHWHVILYLTIDLPAPNEPRFNKYRNLSDPSVLPYSYTLSPTPHNLRETADAPLQKWYSIPATNALPLIPLPVSFPDLAQYLIAALEESRRSQSDRTAGLGRLAKAVDTLYPGAASASQEGEEGEDGGGGGSFVGRIGKLFGRGQSAQSARPANDDRATLVTPFYADNYGR